MNIKKELGYNALYLNYRKMVCLPGTGDGVVDLNTGRSGHCNGGDEEHYHSCPHWLHPSEEGERI